MWAGFAALGRSRLSCRKHNWTAPVELTAVQPSPWLYRESSALKVTPRKQNTEREGPIPIQPKRKPPDKFNTNKRTSKRIQQKRADFTLLPQRLRPLAQDLVGLLTPNPAWQIIALCERQPILARVCRFCLRRRKTSRSMDRCNCRPDSPSPQRSVELAFGLAAAKENISTTRLSKTLWNCTMRRTCGLPDEHVSMEAHHFSTPQ